MVVKAPKEVTISVQNNQTIIYDYVLQSNNDNEVLWAMKRQLMRGVMAGGGGSLGRSFLNINRIKVVE